MRVRRKQGNPCEQRTRRRSPSGTRCTPSSLPPLLYATEIKSSLYSSGSPRNTFLQAMEERNTSLCPFGESRVWAGLMSLLCFGLPFGQKKFQCAEKQPRKLFSYAWERRHFLSILQVLLAQITVKPKHFIYKNANVL